MKKKLVVLVRDRWEAVNGLVEGKDTYYIIDESDLDSFSRNMGDSKVIVTPFTVGEILKKFPKLGENL